MSRPSYNIGAFSCSPETLGNELKKYMPDFKVECLPDYRQDIADSWPNTTDTEMANKDWGFEPKYNFENSTSDVLKDVYNICQKEGTASIKIHNINYDVLKETSPKTSF